MANLAYQVTEFAYQGAGLYAYQGSVDDTHDGFDEDSHAKAKDAERRHAKEFRSARERLRGIIERAWDGPGPVAAEVQSAASPFVEILESGTPRIDYAALERNKAVMAEILAFQDAMRAEYQAREDEDDEDDVMLLTQWS